ncbi:hypothetical protein DAPPUDRAFT_320344 [Daphnia pulex]|uniref:FLYWCH-type domain-containing protein n=1 Tax=Daphnia pulex TaxID=6669 RepID=E9GPL1_DAPPU|nr:hypothetical protein DAPPUDRAFT_320344 [Daphnia pulex]|eukprot:EFX78657.1 hypothetical protein DAPPUDRAFT_320344 [Daphnia pulex]
MEISDDSDAISDSEEEYSRSIGTIVTVNRMQGEKKNGTLYSTGHYLFHLAKRCTHSVNYKCRKHKEFHCGARLVYKDGVYRISGTHHTHPIEDDEIGRISFVNECCRRAGLQRAPGELKSIFEETRRDFPDVSIGYNAALEKRMYRAQQKRKPPNPTSFDEAEELIREHPHYSKTLDGSSDFFKARVSTATGTAFIFLSITLLTQLRTTKQIQADGTFKTVPNLFYQLFTLHFKAYKKSFPVAFVLMSEKSLDLYNAVMEKILDTLQEIDPDREEQIYAGFMAIQQENAADLQLESQEIQDAVQRLYVYWAGYWLVRQTPARFSVNGDKSHTNNEVENWNRWFNARCHGHRQNFWALIYHLQECEETARRDFLVASRGGEIRRPTPNRYIVRDEQILDLTTRVCQKMYWKHLHLVDNVDWPVAGAMEGNRFEQEPEHSEEIKVNRRLMLLVAQLDGHLEEIEVNRRLMLLVAQLDGHHEEIEVNRRLMLLVAQLDGQHEEIEVNQRLMLLVTQLDGHHEEIEVNRRLMLLVAQLDGHHEEIEVNRWQMLLRFYAKFV